VCLWRLPAATSVLYSMLESHHFSASLSHAPWLPMSQVLPRSVNVVAELDIATLGMSGAGCECSQVLSFG
jgi:hypothetical protein